MTDARFIPCPYCGSEGRHFEIRRHLYREPDEIDCGPCGACEGTGWMEVEVFPIELEDLAEVAEPSP